MKSVMIYRTMLIVFALVLSGSCGTGEIGDFSLSGNGINGPGYGQTPDANSGNERVAGGGIGGTGISVGRITGFGSVFVNGVEFDTDDAVIILDGQDGDESDLRIGMVVTVEGRYDANGTSGTAMSVEFKDYLEGPVEGVDISAMTLVVLGHNVIVDKTTVFDGVANLDAIYEGNIVEVSGFLDTNGSIRATYISVKAESFIKDETEIGLKGFISNLDADVGTFTIGNMTINFSNAELKYITGDTLSNGLFVEVKSTSGISDNGVLDAGSVEAGQSSFSTVAGEKVEIEGIVTVYNSTTDFAVNGQPVLITDETRFENGSEAYIALDVRLEVEGKIDADGVLVADEVSFETEDDSTSESGDDSVPDTEDNEMDDEEESHDTLSAERTSTDIDSYRLSEYDDESMDNSSASLEEESTSVNEYMVDDDVLHGIDGTSVDTEDKSGDESYDDDY